MELGNRDKERELISLCGSLNVIRLRYKKLEVDFSKPSSTVSVENSRNRRVPNAFLDNPLDVEQSRIDNVVSGDNLL